LSSLYNTKWIWDVDWKLQKIFLFFINFDVLEISIVIFVLKMSFVVIYSLSSFLEHKLYLRYRLETKINGDFCFESVLSFIYSLFSLYNTKWIWDINWWKGEVKWARMKIYHFVLPFVFFLIIALWNLSC
jgi:hypothetical protein